MIFLKPKNNQKNEKFSYQKNVYVLQKIKFLASISAESGFHFNFSLFHFISFQKCYQHRYTRTNFRFYQMYFV